MPRSASQRNWIQSQQLALIGRDARTRNSAERVFQDVELGRTRLVALFTHLSETQLCSAEVPPQSFHFAAWRWNSQHSSWIEAFLSFSVGATEIAILKRDALTNEGFSGIDLSRRVEASGVLDEVICLLEPSAACSGFKEKLVSLSLQGNPGTAGSGAR